MKEITASEVSLRLKELKLRSREIEEKLWDPILDLMLEKIYEKYPKC